MTFDRVWARLRSIANRLQARPCLDWPDSEGRWWADYSGGGTTAYIIEADWFGSELRLLGGIGGSTAAKEYHQRHGPARFTKLLEQSPFEAQP
jgi:hypothetical protein